jgi:membrane-associated protease RseP (regulator of RpoE activity)
MTARVRDGGRVILKALAVAMGIWGIQVSSARADGAQFQGFGLGYHLGYGYGGSALGVGPDGGNPYYAGPGYPQCWPVLNRGCGITPFPYNGGPGFPTPEFPYFYGGAGPLSPTRQVVTIGGAAGYGTGYGLFTGTLPYTEAQLAPFTTAAGTRGSYSAPGAPAPTPPAAVPNAPQGRTLGIDVEPIVDATGVRGLKVSRVHPGSAAEKAGLHAGDVLYSLNGYLTTQRSDVAWVLANAVSDNILRMKVIAASDGTEHTISVRLP